MDDWLEPAFANLLENKKFSDCQIIVGKESFDSHKVILASASEFFERMFLSDFKESKSGQFRLSEVKPETFAKFLHYVYTYNKKKLEENTNLMIMELLSCGSTWLVQSITSDCAAILKVRAPNMVISDLVELFQYAHNTNNKELIEISVKYLRSRFGTTMNCYDALLLTSDVFEQYTIISEGYLPEIERFKMIESYVTVNGLIEHVTEEPSEDVVDDKKEGTDSGVGEMVIPKSSSEDSEDEISELDGQPGTSKAICDSNQKNPDTVHKGVHRPDEPKDSKIKLIHHKYVKTLLGYIKFSKMAKNEFYNIIGKSALLSDKEKYENLFLTY
ncbi:kelch repeat and BTB domain-containing protein 3-like [Drosophila takahashii]|uniref:kelch repeat and BTB domain-containing protein 3-like n=1 Tax=Drosophila takahashii TaxID=29030 RepID=UPI001CF8CE7C|nr:kelch repeat and BTB domain-containing protein 3-like [Drosophila takahashii]